MTTCWRCRSCSAPRSRAPRSRRYAMPDWSHQSRRTRPAGISSPSNWRTRKRSTIGSRAPTSSPTCAGIAFASASAAITPRTRSRPRSLPLRARSRKTRVVPDDAECRRGLDGAGMAYVQAHGREDNMVATVDFSAGGYRFLPGVFQYSGGVAALSGHAVERARFRTLLPLKQGIERIERLIAAVGRPLTAFCACELRSPAPFTEQGFRAFNESYVVTLQKWGLFDGKVNPVARSNLCPEIHPPPEPCFHAFSFTTAETDAAPSFVIAGSAETREGSGSYSERTIRRGESSPEAMREKASYVLGEMERRLATLGLG